MKQTSDGLFQHPGLRSVLIKLRLPLFIGVLVVLALFAQREWLLAGFIVSMFGEFIQIWCFASLDKNATLTIRGPYTMVRNPMYLGMALLLLALALHQSHALSFAWVAGYVAYLNRFQIRPEERALETLFGDEYRAYARAVRRWI